MKFDMRAIARAQCYKLMTSSITPRPIAWVTSISNAGIRNAAPYSFFNMMGDDPPIVALGFMQLGESDLKDSAANILETGEFVINLVTERDAAAMNLTCVDAPSHVDEIDWAGLDVVASDYVRAPRITTAPVNFECKLVSSHMPGGRQVVVFGEVIAMHVRDEFVLDADRCYLDTLAMNLVARMHGAGWYSRTKDLFQLERPVYPR